MTSSFCATHTHTCVRPLTICTLTPKQAKWKSKMEPREVRREAETRNGLGVLLMPTAVQFHLVITTAPRAPTHLVFPALNSWES